MYVIMNKEFVYEIKEGLTLESMRKKYPHEEFQKCEEPPSWEKVQEFVNTGNCTCPDGCHGIEPDGYCRHGVAAWPLALGLVTEKRSKKDEIFWKH